MITLYDFGNSVCCQKVRVTLCEKGLEWQAIKVDLFRSEQYDPNYLKLNPKGVVPTLVHDGKPVIESTLICEYIDETFPEPRLVPADPWLRSQMRLWSKMVDEGLFEGITEISFSAMFRERIRNMPQEMREIRFRNIGDPRRRDRFKSTYEMGVHSPYVLYAIAAYERAFKLLEETLAESGPWLVGARPTLADINLMPLLARLDYLGLLDLWIKERPFVSGSWALAREWPSFRRGLSNLISEAEFAEMRTYGPNIRDEMATLLAEIREGRCSRVEQYVSPCLRVSSGQGWHNMPANFQVACKVQFFSASIHHIRAPFEPTRQTRRAFALATKKSDHPKSISGSC